MSAEAISRADLLRAQESEVSRETEHEVSRENTVSTSLVSEITLVSVAKYKARRDDARSMS